MIEKANAKINLSLNVKGKLDDGYHDLETIMLPLELHDSLEISKLPSYSTDDYVTCDDCSLKITKYNLVHLIIDAAREKFGFKDHFIVSIHKNIFLQGGLGGGSADEGAALRAILQILNIKPTQEDLIEIGIKIGSDIPWAIFNKPTLLKRKGEILEFYDHVAPFHVFLVKPQEGLSTKAVFNTADTFSRLEHGDINKVKELYENDDLIGLGKVCFNSLETPAISMLPEIASIISSLKEDGFECVRMTGSGSTVFALTNNKKLIKNAWKKYVNLGYDVEMTNFIKE